MRISARNKLKGVVLDVTKGVITAHVRIDIAGQIVTAAITNEFGRRVAARAGHARLRRHQGQRRDGRR